MHPSNFDVIVVGGGIVGAMTADALLQRGQQMLLVDQFEPGHVHGSSHGDGRIFRLGYPQSVYVEMALLAKTAWEVLAARVGEPLMQRTGGWECGPVGGQWLHELEATFRDFAIPYERFSATESKRQFPHFALGAKSEVIFHPDAGVIFATRAVQAMWRLVNEGGGSTISGERIEDIDIRNDLIVVHTKSGLQWQAERLVITAGGWSKQLLARLGLELPLCITQEQVTYFAPKGPLNHCLGAMPVCSDYHLPNSIYVLPQVEVPGLKIGWHQTGVPIELDQPRSFNEANLDVVRHFVRQRLPQLEDSPCHWHTCLYTNTPDSNFILDRHPAHANVVIGAGFSGHGFKFGPVLGQILADLVLGEHPPVSLDMFRVDRFAPSPKE